MIRVKTAPSLITQVPVWIIGVVVLALKVAHVWMSLLYVREHTKVMENTQIPALVQDSETVLKHSMPGYTGNFKPTRPA
tara:strand:+ start:242 stop:478 length:237 start_codon:yes stop_codon:yes gene_type:complete